MFQNDRLPIPLLAAIVFAAISIPAEAQDPGPDGIIPQPYWALTNHTRDRRADGRHRQRCGRRGSGWAH